MKIQSVTNNNYEAGCRKNNIAVQHPCLSAQPAKDSVSFGSAVKTGAAKFFNSIDKKGFFVEFLVIDTLSMIIPRVLIGLDRDKEKTGKVNYKAGAEEAGREILSGPSMGLIPMAILYAVGASRPASHLQKNTLEGLTDNMKQVVAKASDLTSHEKLQQGLAGQLFDTAFGEHKLDGKAELKTKFCNLLDESTKLDSRMFKNAEFKTKAEEFEKLVSEISNKIEVEKATLDTKSVHLGFNKKGDALNVGANDLFKDFRNYSKDVIAKDIVAKVTKETTAKSVEANLEKALKSRLNIKTGTAVAGFLAVGAFLLYLPKLYQQSGLSPAQESAKRAQAEVAQGGANENK